MKRRLISILLTLCMVLTLLATTALAADTKAGDTIQFGGYDWRVLEIQGGRALLLSDKILEFRMYNAELVDDITWEDSTLRTYLNGEFYNSFSAADRARITETRVVNNDNPWHRTPGGNDTTDRIFLLSLEEVVKFFGDSRKLANGPADPYYITDQYDNARKAYRADTGGGGGWFLRSPGGPTSEGNNRAAHVGSDGTIHPTGLMVYSKTGVRPALWLNLKGGGTTPPPTPTPQQSPASGNKTAAPTNTTFMLNNAEVALPAYLIDGNNYVKLRDVAALLATRFDVRWMDGKARLYNHTAYTPVGGELAADGTENKTAAPSNTDFVWGGTGEVVTGLSAYLIEGNNYIKLRDIAKLFDFDVDWRDGKAWIEPDVSPYTED